MRIDVDTKKHTKQKSNTPFWFNVCWSASTSLPRDWSLRRFLQARDRGMFHTRNSVSVSATLRKLRYLSCKTRSTETIERPSLCVSFISNLQGVKKWTWLRHLQAAMTPMTLAPNTPWYSLTIYSDWRDRPSPRIIPTHVTVCAPQSKHWCHGLWVWPLRVHTPYFANTLLGALRNVHKMAVL